MYIYCVTNTVNWLVYNIRKENINAVALSKIFVKGHDNH